MRRLVLLLFVAFTGCTVATGATSMVPTASVTPTRSQAAQTPDPAPVSPVPDRPVFVAAAGAWVDAIDAAVAGRDVSVAVGLGNRIVYRNRSETPRVLASNEKLLTSMAALDILGAGYRFRTAAATADAVRNGVLRGDLWLIGGGDPTLTTTDLATLAARLADAGLRRISGGIVGDTSAFNRGWWAPGWLPHISRAFVDRPTALRLAAPGAATEDAAAAAFRTALLDGGIAVGGRSTTGAAPEGTETLATDRSPPLSVLLAHQNHESDNLYAELTAKLLGAVSTQRPGSTAAGARAIRSWATTYGVEAAVRDGSGLSDLDRTSALGVVTLLLAAQRRTWYPTFERSLPTGGTGTLAGRLIGLPVHAKTGTLFVRPASTLSGYVTTRNGRTVAFSVLTHDLPETTAEAIEDAVVRALAGASIG